MSLHGPLQGYLYLVMESSGEVRFYERREAGWVLFVREEQSVSMGVTALFSLPRPKRAGVLYVVAGLFHECRIRQALEEFCLLGYNAV
jgi:hypothetical protein